MIRNNEATELCVTKGQEAVVVGWDAFCGPYDHQILETLFVQLKNPPKDVQLADLPNECHSSDENGNQHTMQSQK